MNFSPDVIDFIELYRVDASAENDEDNEEIFAENYDERDDQHVSTTPKKVR